MQADPMGKTGRGYGEMLEQDESRFLSNPPASSLR
jgi:hypothetical protein